MADIDQIIAGGAGASSRADFSGLSKLLDSYWTGKDQAAKNDLRDAFKGGVPLTPDGQLDTQAVMKTLFQKGDIAGGVGLAGASMGQQDRAALAGIDGPQASQQPLVSPPSANRTASAVVAPPLNKGGLQAQAQQASPQGDQPGSIVSLISAAGIPDELAGPYIQQISAQTKMDPNAALNPELTQRVQQVAQAAAQRMKGGQQPQPSGLGPQQAPVQVAQAQPQTAQAPLQASPDQQAAQNDPILKRLTFLAASQDKATAAAAKVRLESYLKNKEFTGPMKEARDSGLSLQGYQERQGEQAAQQAGASERAKADVKEQQEYIDSGKSASQRLTTLNAISNVVNGDKSPGMGYAGDTELKMKMALQRFGFDFGDLSGAELMQKMNASLASEMAKSLTARSTQFEFKTFLGNNPGLLLDKTGNQRLIGIFSQLAKREVDLGKLARQNQDNWQNWDNVVEKYDAQKEHKIIDPISKQPISTDSIVAPGPSKQPQQASPSLEPGKTMVNGHIYKGGDPRVKANWELRS